jgi:TetR/AcrR family tetracycline transcriptional repressor
MPHAKLDQGTIVAEALTLLGEGGLADVSLRKIAARLNVTVSSLYWHIRDRDQLLALMCETVFRDCLERTPEADSAPGWLRGFALVLWDKQLSLRDCQKLIIVSALDEATRDALKDAVANRLAAYSLDREHATAMQMSIQALVTGWSTLDPKAETRAEFEAALSALLAGWQLTKA